MSQQFYHRNSLSAILLCKCIEKQEESDSQWPELNTSTSSRREQSSVTGTLAQQLECSPMARETWVQSQVESYQRL